MAFNRELSQFASFLELDASANYIGLTSTSSSTKLGIGTAFPDSKFTVVGDVRITGITTASGFVGPLTGNVTGNVTGDVTGDLTGNVTGDVTGNADTATALATTRTIGLSGDLSGSASFDGSANATIAATIQPNSVAMGTDTTGNYVATVADAGSGRITVSGSGSETAAVTLDLADSGVTAASYGSQTAIPVITVDAKGRLTSVSTASVGTALTVTGDSGSEDIDLLSESLSISGGTNVTTTAASNGVSVALDPNVSLTTLTASGAVTGSQFNTGAEGSAIRVTSNTISGPATITLDPAGVGDNTGTVVIAGDLQIDGTTTTVNSTTVTVNDKNIQVADGAANDAAADGGGITVNSGDGNKTFQFEATGDNFGSSENLNLASGKVLKVNNTEVLSANSLTITDVAASGIVTATGGFVGDVTGNADSATALATARTIALSGDVAGSVSFDGSADATITATIQADSVALGNDTTGNYVATVADAGNSNITVTGSGSETAAVTLDLANTGVSAGSYGSTTAIPVITVDAKGRLSSVSTASVGTALTVTGDSGSEDINLLTESLAITGGTNVTTTTNSNSVEVALDSSITLTSVTADLTGDVTGDLTGNVTGDVTGNADTATALQTARTIGGVSFDGSANISLPGVDQTGNQDTTGNAATATALATARTISASGDATGSASFDGSANADIALTLANSGVSAGAYGSTTAIPVVTVNAKGLVTSVSTASVGTALTVTGDSGSEDINLLTESLSISGGTNLTSSASSNGVTLNLNDYVDSTGFTASGVSTATAFHTGAEGSAIRVTSNTISGPATITLDPAGVGDNTGTVVIAGDLQIDGTTTTVNSTTVTVNDKNIQVADGAANDAAADGGGITVNSGDGNKTFQFEATGDNFGSSENLNLATGKVLKVNNTEILSATALSSNVTVAAASVDIDGATDIGGALSDSDEFLVDDGGNGTNRRTDASRISDFVFNKVSGDVTIDSSGSATIQANSVALGNDTTGNYVGEGAVSGNGLSGSLSAEGGTFTVTSNGTAVNTASTLVFRDGSGDFAAGTITAGLVGGVTGPLTGNVNAASGISTFTNMSLTGTLSDTNSQTGTDGYILKTVGTGVSWAAIADVLPTLRTSSVVNATAGQTAFTTNYNVNFLDVFLNGVKLAASEFVATNGTTVTLNEAAYLGDVVEFVSYNTNSPGSGQVSSLNDLTDVSISSPASGNLLNYNGSEWVVTSTLSGISALDATTTATIETAVRAVPNDFNSLNIAGISTFAGIVDANGGANIAGGLVVSDVNVSGVVTATSFVGAVTGNVTGNLTGDVTGDVTGNVTGNADTATTLATARTIAGNSFDGSANITIAAQDLSDVDQDLATTDSVTFAGVTAPLTGDVTGDVTGDLTGNVTGNVTGNLTGTVQTASQPNITSVGTLSSLTISGDLTVNGTTTTINSTTLSVDDKNITLGDTSSPSDSAADGGGITLKGSSDHTFNWVNSNDAWTSSEHMNLASGKGYMLNGTTVLSGTTLGSTIVSSSLESVGTISSGTWQGTAIANAYLANSTISGVALGGTLGTLTGATSGTGLSGSVSYDGSGNQTFTVTSNATSANTASTIVARDGSGNFTAGTVTCTDLNTTSDIALKDNINVIDNALDMISRLDGITWNWKADGRASMGVSAQNVESVAPELVAQGDHKSVNYNGLVGVLIAAVKELSAEVAELKK